MGSGWPLTGRTEELKAITESLDTAGAAGIVLAGAAGVGKTRLAREALTRAGRRGRDCRFVAATASAQSVPLGAFADYADRLGPDPLARVRDVVDAVTCTSRRGPVVVGVDDAHLLDEQSALVVHQIVRRQLATVVLTVRTGEPAPDAITALWKDELLPRLEVQPLSRAETASLLGCVLAGDVESSTAERIWDYTRGNALYLRQLIADELAAGRFTQRSGLWIWDTQLRMSPSLADLIDTTIGRQPDPVLAVLDVLAVLAVADPVELAVLSAMTPVEAIDAAEAAGVITVDTSSDPVVARTAHPLFGEVRRARAGTMRLRHLRGRVATELANTVPRPDLIQRVRRATLVIDSDLTPDPEQLMDASSAALELMDPTTAERLAHAALHAGGRRRAHVLHALALASCDRLGEALGTYAELTETASTDRARVIHTLGRALLLARASEPDAAEHELAAIRDRIADHGLERPYNCVLAALAAFQGHPQIAVDAAAAGLSEPGWTHASFEFTGIAGLVVGLGELGRIDAVPDRTQRGYELGRTMIENPMGRFFLGSMHIAACQLAGRITEAQAVADRLAGEPMDNPLARTHRAVLWGSTALARGDLTLAGRLFREATAIAASLEYPIANRLTGQHRHALALVMAGDHASAAALLQSGAHARTVPDYFGFEATLVQAWVYAAGGTTSDAIALLHDYARRAAECARSACEVLCLQTSAQFGDRTVAARLVELASIVQGPRVAAAATHAAALRDRDGDGLREAATLYEAFGDRIAAADAAAQAAVLYREQGRRGAAMTASAVARRLSAETGADTPALRANTVPIPLTDRQREIIALAATGLSNREIAHRLVMSVRTVEGHLFRASQKTGVNGRDELIALLGSRPAARH
ncbi:MAG TPA: LuxR C-terminal-related transcriptional regulator [Aldersonia sp.]